MNWQGGDGVKVKGCPLAPHAPVRAAVIQGTETPPQLFPQ